MNITRRTFLTRLGWASAAVAATAVTGGCTSGPAPKSHAPGDGRSTHTGEIPADQMTYRVNPNSGDRVSLLGYGMMRLPTVAAGMARPDGCDIDQEQVNRLVDFALAHGINYFDTSPAYCKGFSEEATGTALARHPRDTYFIATKLSNFAPQTQTFEASRQMFEHSLQMLRTSYIDYLLLHSIGGGGMENFNHRFMDNGLLDWLVEQKRKGRIRNLGFSFHGEQVVFDEMLRWHDEGRYHWDFVQIQMNYVDWTRAQRQNKRNIDAKYLYGELERRGIPAVIMEPLLGGRLSRLPDHVVEHLKERAPEDSAASWAFRFCGTWPGVLTSLSGMTYMEHLEDNLRTHCPMKPLDESELAYLDEAAELILSYPLVPCNDCKYCMPCPYGIDIPAIFVHYNKMVGEGKLPSGESDPAYERMRRDYLVSYDRAIPRLRQADHCIGCDQCSPHCPQNIRIPQQLHRLAHMVEDFKLNAPTIG